MSKESQKMTYTRLGKSGLKVSRIILGTMSYGSKDWQKWVLDEAAGIEHIKFAYEHGINTFDTANVYSNGLSEVTLGKALKELQIPRENVVILTKVFFTVGDTPDYLTLGKSIQEIEEAGYVNRHGLSRKHIFESIKASLKRLQLDYVDVLLCHRFDPDTPIEETMEALHDVVKAGHARYIGMSSCMAYQFTQMQNYAINNRLTPFIVMQNHYNLVYREEEREMMPTLRHFGVGAITWSPLARGLLTRPASETGSTTRGESDMMIKRYAKRDSDKEIIHRLEQVAKELNCQMAQVALAWQLSKEEVSAPIIGTTHLDNLENLLSAVNLKLSKKQVEYLEEPYEAKEVIY